MNLAILPVAALTVAMPLSEQPVIKAVRVAEYCQGYTHSLLDEIRIAQALRRDAAIDVTSLDVAEALQKAREGEPPRCETSQAKEYLNSFQSVVLPRLRGATPPGQSAEAGSAHPRGVGQS